MALTIHGRTDVPAASHAAGAHALIGRPDAGNQILDHASALAADLKPRTHLERQLIKEMARALADLDRSGDAEDAFLSRLLPRSGATSAHRAGAALTLAVSAPALRDASQSRSRAVRELAVHGAPVMSSVNHPKPNTDANSAQVSHRSLHLLQAAQVQA